MHKAHLRRFGVEIECGMDGGYEEAAELFDFPYHEDGYGGYYDDRDDGWFVCDDGSGVELCTPPLKGEAGFKTLRSAMDKLARNGAWVSDYDGLHVHHDAPEFVEDPRLCVPLLESWLNNEDTIREFVSPRRHSRMACPRWQDGDVERLRQWAEGDADFYFQRNDLNIAALREHGTIEIRLLEGTLDADVAIAWIQFGQRFIHEVVENALPLAPAPSDRDLLSQIKLSAQARRILAEKQANAHITSRQLFRDIDDGYYDDEY